MTMHNFKTFRSLYLIAFTLMMIIALPVTAQAESKIGVVNVQKIMSESKAAKSIQEQLQKHRKTFQEEVSSHERELLEEQKSLAEMQSDLPPEEFSKKREEFEGRLRETRKLVEKRKQALEEAVGNAVGDLRKEVLEIVSELADKEDYSLIITKQNVMLAQKDIDITAQVMKKLDKSLKEIELKVKTN